MKNQSAATDQRELRGCESGESLGFYESLLSFMIDRRLQDSKQREFAVPATAANQFIHTCLSVCKCSSTLSNNTHRLIRERLERGPGSGDFLISQGKGQNLPGSRLELAPAIDSRADF